MSGSNQAVLKGQHWQVKRVPADLPILYTDFENWRILQPGELIEIVSEELREFFQTHDFPAGSTACVYYAVKLLAPEKACSGLIHLRDFKSWSLELVKESTVKTK